MKRSEKSKNNEQDLINDFDVKMLCKIIYFIIKQKIYFMFSAKETIKIEKKHIPMVYHGNLHTLMYEYCACKIEEILNTYNVSSKSAFSLLIGLCAVQLLPTRLFCALKQVFSSTNDIISLLLSTFMTNV